MFLPEYTPLSLYEFHTDFPKDNSPCKIPKRYGCSDEKHIAMRADVGEKHLS